jgi:surfeit locus 1 family protein
MSLGFWQLYRAEEKRMLLNTEAQNVMIPGLHLTATSEIKVDRDRYKKIEVSGQYEDAHQYLLDNQISSGKAGYLVLTPLRIEGTNKAVLINRGWIPLNQDRSILPDVRLDPFSGVIKGRINRFPSVGLKLPGADEPSKNWPSVVQVVDSEKLSTRLGYSLFDFQIELDKELPNGFKREWQTAQIMPPEQHTAYAIQWFGLAFTLTVIFIGSSLKKNND